MGTWGTAIFADDFARDVRDAYLDKLANGEKPAEASRSVIEELGAAELDGDEGPIFWLALAATQWEYGALDANVKRRALEILDRGGDAGTWREAGRNARRVAALAALAKKLRSPLPRVKRPKRRGRVEAPSRTVPSPDGRANATAFIIGNLAQVAIDIPRLGGGGGVFSATCALDDIELRWHGNRKLEITYPAKVKMSPQIGGDPDEFYLSGHTIALVFTKRR